MSLDSTLEPPAVYGWDWTATTFACREDDDTDADDLVRNVVRGSLDALGGAVVLPGKGLQGWGKSLQAFDGEGFRLGQVYFGGGRTDVHVVSSGAAADVARDALLTRTVGSDGWAGVKGDGWGTARVDTRVDSEVPFEDLAAICEEAAQGYGSMITRVESSQRGESLGRTVYLGAPSSAIRVRLYEKWLESPGQYVEGTNRVEVQLRPGSRVKAKVSGWSRAETFCASRVTRALAERLGADLAPVASLHVDRGTPDLERSLAAMGDQYRRAVGRWLDVSGGDVGRVLDHLGVWADPA